MIAAFLDRDGVINHDRDDYVKSVDELVIYPWVAESVVRLNRAGYGVFVVSNQQGVAKGLISEDTLRAIQDEITRQVEAVDGSITAFYHCPHLSSSQCSCRKPRPGMLITAAREHGIDLARSVMIGDSEKDMKAGKAAGCHTVLVLTGFSTSEDAQRMSRRPDFVADNLLTASEYAVGLAEGKYTVDSKQ